MKFRKMKKQKRKKNRKQTKIKRIDHRKCNVRWSILFIFCLLLPHGMNEIVFGERRGRGQKTISFLPSGAKTQKKENIPYLRCGSEAASEIWYVFFFRLFSLNESNSNIPFRFLLFLLSFPDTPCKEGAS